MSLSRLSYGCSENRQEGIGLGVNFTMDSFLGPFRHRTYIESGKYAHVDEHYELKKKGDGVVPGC